MLILLYSIMNEQNKYLEKFYKRNMSIDEIKKTYTEPKSVIDSPSLIQCENTIYYMTYSQKIFLWLFLCGIIYKVSNFFI